MDIGIFGVQQLNPALNPFSVSPGGLAPGLRTGEPGAFEDLLRRAQGTGGQERETQVNPSLPSVVKDPELYELCLELETILIKNLISGMRNTVQKSNLIDTGFAGEIYEDMLYDEYAKMMARNASLGFAEMAYRELAGLR